MEVLGGGLARCLVSDPSISITSSELSLHQPGEHCTNRDAGRHLLSYLSILWGSWVNSFVVLGKVCLSKRQSSVTAHKNIYDLEEIKIKKYSFWKLLPRDCRAPLIPLLLLTHRTNMESHHTGRVRQNVGRRTSCLPWLFSKVVTVTKMSNTAPLIASLSNTFWRIAELPCRQAVNT